MKLHLLLVLAAVCALVMQPGSAVQADDHRGSPFLFPETGHTLAYNFRQFYEALNGRLVFGSPLTEVFLEDGRPVQYFEQARLEWHADRDEVRIGDLGRWAAVTHTAEPAFQPLSALSGDASQVMAGHRLSGDFRRFFEHFGGRAIFGAQISEALQEARGPEGYHYMVQYFERARLELHPDLPWPYTVSPSQLGRQYLAAHTALAWAARPVDSPAHAWDNVRPTHVSVPRIGVDVDVEERGASLGAWDVPRSTVGHFWPVAAYPGTSGNIVLGGHSNYADSIFNHLPEARIGDEVQVFAGGQVRRYIVREITIVTPQDTSVMRPTAVETLTLITCYPVGVSSHRLIVRATPVL
jgi:LPXTG-site transpeptidase (sortase) family protein